MQKEKQKYIVYCREIWYFESTDQETVGDWYRVGETLAVSGKQAINNVRHRIVGDVSQYLPVEAEGHYEHDWEWHAEIVL